MTTINPAVSLTIINQLGGNKFKAMTGSNTFMAHQDGVSFRVPKTGKINHLKITLNPKDLYDMEFGRIYGGDLKDHYQDR